MSMAKIAASLFVAALQLGCIVPSFPRGYAQKDGAWTPSRDDASTAAVIAPEPEIVETTDERERKVLQPRVRQLLDDGNFDELERVAAAKLAHDAPLVSGWSSSDMFYVAFKDQPDDTP